MSDSSDLRGPALPKRGAEFEPFYNGTPPWDIGRPQRAFRELADRGAFRGRVLDVGCGSGEHALLATERGFEATGIDAAPTAIKRARTKATQRRMDVRFILGDVLDLPGVLDARFDTVIDSALFHVFDDEDRPRFVDALAAVTATGGCYFMLCFSEHAPGTGGPRRVTQAEIRSSFATGWRVESVHAAHIETIGMAVPAWLATIIRT